MHINCVNKLAIAAGLSIIVATGCSTAASNSSNKIAATAQETTTPTTPTETISSLVSPAANGTEDSTPEVVTSESNTPEHNAVADTTVITYFTDAAGQAIRGTDPVAYFTAGAAITGRAEFSYTWGNATWQFASAENRDRFAADPEKYAPQYGGFCAWAVSRGYTASTDPEAWKIVEGKLYLNYDKGIQRRWEQDIPGNIARADRNWPGVLTQS
ncbi:MAG: YHS domain-containing (seleno)protein [Cyanobacteria bacterium P01_G01_bin.54]